MRGGRAASISATARPAARKAPRPPPTSPTGRAALRAGVELRTHCRVREITTNEHGMASGVVYYDNDGVEQFQPAEVVIIACNGIGTPRLLLNSASGAFSERARQFLRPGRQEPDVPSLCPGLRLCRGADRQQPRAADLPVEQGILRDRSSREASCAATRFQFGRGVGPVFEAVTSEAKGILPWGADHHRVFRKLNGHRLAAIGDLRGSAGRAQPRHARSRA